MYSNGHRANLLTAKISKFGYGIVTRADGQIYAVQMFSNELPSGEFCQMQISTGIVGYP
ncbi:CAP domain-containing protein [Cylindrospermum stagnale]|uniref:CAP domain-containing protein n=1 Tax=Cylindrospermum stagnale TaxID=142864 RepID=UPI00031FAF6C|nr:hypothetical protein [Cylindrospermum stagnale]